MSTIGALAVGYRAVRDAKRAHRSHAAAGRARVGLAIGAAKIRQSFGTVAGLGCLTAAAWSVALPLGLVVAGLAAFVLEWRLAE